jgi:hypothetical protein
MIAKTFIVGAGVAIAVVALYLDWRGSRAEATAPHSPPSLTTGEPARRPELVLRSPPPVVEVPAAGANDRPAAEPGAPRTAQPRPSKTPSETPIEQFAHVHDTLERSFAAEPSDGAWAMVARRSVETRFADLPAASRLRSIDCRSTLCRIETLHDGYSDARAFTHRLASLDQPAWNGGFFTGPIAQDPQSGAVTFVTYLVREGMAMPVIPDGAGDDPSGL